MSYTSGRGSILLFSFALLAGPAPQDDELQKNTALLRMFSGNDQLVDKADALAAAGKYEQAMEIYAEAQKNPNSLVPIERKGNSPERYLGVLEFCLRRIASWPPEGRAAARRHADPVAGQAFRAAQASRDHQALADVALRFPYSSFADDALALLGNLHLEAGRASEAAAMFDRLLALPDAELSRPVIFARLGEALARAGRPGAIASLIARVGRETPGAKVILGDREVPLVETLETLARSAPLPPPAAMMPASWEMMQGHPSGVRVAEPAEAGLRQWTARLDEARYVSEDDEMGRGYSDLGPDAYYRPVVPAVSEGIVYFHTEYSVQAWNLYAEATEPLWNHRLPVPSGELMHEDRLVHSTTVSDGRVFANLVTALGQREVQSSYIQVKFPFPKRALFAFDAYTGRVLWRIGGVAAADRFEDGLSFSTAPTPVEGMLYVGAVRQPHPTDPFEHHVVCLDPETGRVVWSTFVASGGTEINLFGNSTRESLGSPVGVDGDSVYYTSNHGAVASLDRTTGRIRWVSRYRQLPVRPTRQIEIQRRSLEWLPSAPVVARGVVVCAPTDSRFLYAYDAASGEEMWSRRRGEGRAIAGCDGANLVICGDGLEWIDVTKGGEKPVAKYSPAGIHATGRAVLTSTGVLLPTKDGLYRVSLVPAESPRAEYSPWRGSSEGGGNVVVAEGAVVVANRRTVEVFLSRSAVDAAVEAELKAHPDRPEVLYRAGLRLLQSGKSDKASDLFERVIELVSGSLRAADSRLERSARKRLFAAAKSAGQAALADKKPEEAIAAFKRAAKAAPDTASVVESATMLAEAALARGDLSAAIAEFQRLLKESGDQIVGGVRVFEIARNVISKVLASGGREAYQPFEDEAERLRGKAEAAQSASDLLDVFRSYPNSAAAERAVLAAAGLHSKRGAAEEAAATYRMFLREFPESSRTLDVQASLVLELEKKSRFASAAVVLRRMAAAGSQGEVTVDGRRVAVTQFVESRLAREEYKRAEGTSSPIRLSPPLKKVSTFTEREFLFGAAVLRPEGPSIPEAAGLVLLNFGGAVKAVDTATGAEAWKMATDLPVRAAFAHEGAFLLCSESFVARVKPATGAVEWKHTPAAPMKSFCKAGAMLCYLMTDPKIGGLASIVALDPGRGSVAWSQEFQGLAKSGVIPADDYVAVVTVAPTQITLFDTETGRAAPSVPLVVKGSGLRVVTALHGVVVLHSNESGLQAFEMPSGKRRWWEKLDRWTVTVMAASPAGLLVGGSERGQPAAILIDLRTGKRRGVAEGLDGVPAAPVAMNDRVAAFAVRRGERNLGVRALDLADSRLKFAWQVKSDRDDLQAVPLLAEEHAAILHLSAMDEGKFSWSVDLLDRSGRPVQNMKAEVALERPPAVALSNDAMILLVENRVEVYR